MFSRAALRKLSGGAVGAGFLGSLLSQQPAFCKPSTNDTIDALSKRIALLEAAQNGPAAKAVKPVLIVGSLNADIIVEIDRLPLTGETIGARNDSTGYMLPGGKGANQAVAVSKMGGEAKFACVFGNDSHAATLKGVLAANSVDTSCCGTCDRPSGQAFIFLEKNGSNSIISVGAANQAWPDELSPALAEAVRGASAVMLQREIPERVNLQVPPPPHNPRPSPNPTPRPPSPRG